MLLLLETNMEMGTSPAGSTGEIPDGAASHRSRLASFRSLRSCSSSLVVTTSTAPPTTAPVALAAPPITAPVAPTAALTQPDVMNSSEQATIVFRLDLPATRTLGGLQTANLAHRDLQNLNGSVICGREARSSVELKGVGRDQLGRAGDALDADALYVMDCGSIARI